MEPWQEPVRGNEMPPAAFALSGLERIRGWGRGLWGNTPMHHLTGYRSTQVGFGTAVGSMPISPWILSMDGRHYDMSMLPWATAALAVTSTFPAGVGTATPSTMSYSLIRNLDPATRSAVARCNVVRSTPHWVFVNGTVEDGDGRVAVQMSADFKAGKPDVRVPDEPPPFEPVDPPSYPTPDPYQRPVPPEIHSVHESFAENGAAETIRAIVAGDLPKPAIQQLLGFRYVSFDEVEVEVEWTTSPWLAVWGGTVAPPYIGAALTSAASALGFGSAPTGHMPSIVTGTFTHLTDVPPDGRKLAVRARAERLSDEVLSVSVGMFDGDRRVAAGHHVNLSEPLPRSRRAAGRRALATVLLTDIVGSTAEAERRGDAAWAELLDQHGALVGTELDEHDGRRIKSTGDGVLATFESPVRAVECARAIRRAVQRLGVQVRAGVHTGECEFADGDVTGLAVHVAARVEATAGPGEVWVSETTKGLTVGSGLSFTDQGEHELKGLGEPIRLYSLVDGVG